MNTHTHTHTLTHMSHFHRVVHTHRVRELGMCRAWLLIIPAYTHTQMYYLILTTTETQHTHTHTHASTLTHTHKHACSHTHTHTHTYKFTLTPTHRRTTTHWGQLERRLPFHSSWLIPLKPTVEYYPEAISARAHRWRQLM